MRKPGTRAGSATADPTSGRRHHPAHSESYLTGWPFLSAGWNFQVLAGLRSIMSGNRTGRDVIRACCTIATLVDQQFHRVRPLPIRIGRRHRRQLGRIDHGGLHVERGAGIHERDRRRAPPGPEQVARRAALPSRLQQRFQVEPEAESADRAAKPARVVASRRHWDLAEDPSARASPFTTRRACCVGRRGLLVAAAGSAGSASTLASAGDGVTSCCAFCTTFVAAAATAAPNPRTGANSRSFLIHAGR